MQLKTQKKLNFFTNYIKKLGSFLIHTGNQLRSWVLDEPEPASAIPKKRKSNQHLALIAGYFSYPDGYATFGDTQAMHLVADWLKSMNVEYDIACHHSNNFQGVSLHHVDPSEYDIFIFVCGPWRSANQDVIEKFKHSIKIGVNLSIEDEASNTFDFLYPRDLPKKFNPDIVFSAPYQEKPLIGVCLVHPQKEYGDRQRHHHVNQVVHEYLEKYDLPYIYLDTLYRNNPVKIPNTQSFETLLRKVDVVISSRLHGMVFSLKNGTPVVAIDAIAGGAKLTSQAKALSWPYILNGDKLTSEQIDVAVNDCLKEDARDLVVQVRESALDKIKQIELQFKQDLTKRLNDASL